MSHVVAKPFNTVNRRFKVGDAVDPSDVEPLDFAGLKKGGFVTEPKRERPQRNVSES